jgi:hypothetical protein
MSSIYNGIDIYKFINWIYFLIFIILISKSLVLFTEFEIIKSLIIGGYLFTFSIVITYLSLTINIPFVTQFILDNIFKFPGWFQTMDVLGVQITQIYFQATLILTTLAIVAYIYKYKLTFYFFTIILILTLSRFGPFTILVHIILIKIFGIKRLSKIIVLYFIPMVITSLLIFAMIYLQNMNYSATEESLSVRIGHVVSIFNSFDIINFIFGQGAGSTFFSIGSNKIVNNIELSQLEFLRKFGIIGYALLHMIIIIVLKQLYKVGQYKVIIVIFSYYFVSFSNPILTSISFSFILSVGISLMYINNHKGTS